MKFKMGLAEATSIIIGALVGAGIAQLVGRLYTRYPLVSRIYGAFTVPAILGLFLTAAGPGRFREIGTGMMAYGVGKLAYNGIINLIER